MTGIPILFAPGNGGSYEQVRSLGSTVLKHMFDQNQDPYFDVFTIDYNEEQSGLYGPVLRHQTQFMHEAIKAIRQYYAHVPDRTYQIILIAHSIGGLICKALFTLPDFDPGSVATIITLSTPHLKPVVPLDTETAQFYYQINNWWSKHRNDPKIDRLPIISIHGGNADRLVSAHLTQLTAFESIRSANFDMLTTAIPNVWLQTDHLCVIWCNQINRKLVNMIRDLVSPKTALLKSSLDVRLQVIRYHLYNANQGEVYPRQMPLPALILPSNLKQVEIQHITHRFHFMSRKYVYSPLYLTYTIKPDTWIVVVANGIIRNDWLFGCHQPSNRSIASISLCDESKNLSPLARHVPTLDLNPPKYTKKGHRSSNVLKVNANRKLFVIPANQLLNQRFDHLIVYLNSHQKPFSIVSERYTRSRAQKLTLPTFIQSMMTFFTYSQILRVPVSEESVYYSLEIPNLQSTWTVYKMRLAIVSCYEQASEPVYVHKHVPWFSEDEYFHLHPRKDAAVAFYLLVHVPRPLNHSEFAQLNLLLDPHCGYEISARFAPFESIMQIGQHHAYQFLPSVVAILLSVLSIQVQAKRWHKLTSFEECKQTVGCLPKYLSANQILIHMPLQVSIYGLLPLIPLLISYTIRWIKYMMSQSDFWYIQTVLNFESSYLFANLVQQTILFAVSYSVLFVICIALESFVKMAANIYPHVPFIMRHSSRWSLITMAIGAALLLLSTWTNCLVGLFILIAMHLLQTIHLCAHGRYIEQRQGLTCESTLWKFHVTIATLIVMAILPSLPATISWFLRKHRTSFHENHTITFHVYIVSLALIWQQTFLISRNRQVKPKII